MPGMSGQTLAGQIREMRPETEILFMSGYTEESTLNQGPLRGGRHFLQKPFSPQELGQRVRKLLDESGG
jgi:DNA-binding response OmpR family regulator